MVADPSGCWMQAWDRQFGQQRIEVLRSPGVHHPDPDVMALLHANHYDPCPDRREDMASGGPLRGPLRRPTTVAFAQFCRDVIDRAGLARRVVPTSVFELHQLTSGRPSRWRAVLDDGRSVFARQVVWAGNPRTPNLPPDVAVCRATVHSSEVDIDTATPGQHIAVLGGGQTAGQLALQAARSGAEVTLVSRGPQRISNLDVDAGWLMNDHLGPFQSIDDPWQRRQVVEDARCGSITADLGNALRAAGVRHVCEAGQLSATSSSRGAFIRAGGTALDVDNLWLATGSTPDLRMAPALAQQAACGAPHVDGWPVLDRRLHWQAGLIVIGALAALTLGPAAGNLGGARAAADVLADQTPRLAARAC
ncbi:MAG: FAD-dependent oxidoreductase [Actinomycetota bacterium]